MLLHLLGLVGLLQAPELFAPGIVTKPDTEEAFGSFSPNGREFYFTIHRPDFSRHRIVVSRFDGKTWSEPSQLPFSGRYNDREPRLSPDGKRLYFSSNRPTQSGDTARRADLDVWFVDRDASGGWGNPRHVEGPVNGPGADFCPSQTANGTLYFISIRPGAIGGPGPNVWRAKPIDAANGVYGSVENLGPTINNGTETNVFVTADERLMFVSRDGSPDGFGGDDLFMAEQRANGWQPMQHLAKPVNSAEFEYGPMVSPDGRWLYFTSHRINGDGDIFRVPLAALKVERETTRAERVAVHRALSDYLAEKRSTPATAQRDITIFEVQDQTASAKIHASWGTEYVLLGKHGGRWMISHILWQSPPPR